MYFCIIWTNTNVMYNPLQQYEPCLPVIHADFFFLIIGPQRIVIFGNPVWTVQVTALKTAQKQSMGKTVSSEHSFILNL